MIPDIGSCLLTFTKFSVGHHNGSQNGVQYFSCPPNYGAFVRIDDVLCITSRGVRDRFALCTPLRTYDYLWLIEFKPTCTMKIFTYYTL